MSKSWDNKKSSFPEIDVRKLTNNFLPGILRKAQEVNVGEGICVIQSFEPKPLYTALADLGFEYDLEEISENEFRVYFYRKEIKEMTFKTGADMPFKPTAILNYKIIDDVLAGDIVDFWEQIWELENPAIDIKTKLLLSMSNAIGAGRYRQATRELIKAYSLGATVQEFDELFSLFVWNQGVGHFSSEIGPSTVFGAYKLIKKRKKQSIEDREILDEVMEKFGPENPNVTTII